MNLDYFAAEYERIVLLYGLQQETAVSVSFIYASSIRHRQGREILALFEASLRID
jgi:hypothetical protein